MTAPAPRKIACLTVDVEPDLWCPQQRIRLLEDDARMHALTSLLRRNNVPLTCFVVMQHAARHARSFASLAKAIDVEFAVHSYSHDQRSPATADEVRRAWDTYGELWNRTPRGYRSPNCLIDAQGLRNLARQGFIYDSSVTPSVRFDRFGYNNLHLPTRPFMVHSTETPILEFPVACTAVTRMPFIFSYAKLVGMPAYRLASAMMPLPDIVVTYFHPYDLYVSEIAHHIPGWKRRAHLRGADRPLDLLSEFITILKRRGYSFAKMEDLADAFRGNPSLPVVPIENIKRAG